MTSSNSHKETLQATPTTHTNNILEYIRESNQSEQGNNENETSTQMKTKQDYDQPRREDAIIYADDTNIISMRDTPAQLIQRLHNYLISTQSRQRNIQWEKVLIVTRERTKANQNCPADNLHKHPNEHTWKILGKQLI